jgi:hypothetical protein
MWILDANGKAALDMGNGDAAFWLGNSQYVPLVMRYLAGPQTEESARPENRCGASWVPD